jgi:hypothetical protein
MLWPVSGSPCLHRSPTVARWVHLALLGAFALSALLPARAAFAQEADGGGWFDSPPAPEPAPQPYYDDPGANAETTPAPVSESDVPDTDPSALTTFRPALDPYGSWVTDSRYGTVWVPNRDVVGADFAPYVSRGRWSLTADDDWIWVSDYPFGWAVFHYGRWVWISGNGWSWVPGRTYANAWVVWRVPTAGYAYVGWAPMPPTWGWRHGYAFSLWYSPPLPYVFCPSAYAFHPHVHHHIVRDRHLVRDIAGHTHVHPTPYRAPATPSHRTAATPGIRAAAAPIAASRAPHGPAISAARVPPQAVPAVRTAPPPNAARFSSSRIASSDITRSRLTPSAEARLRSSPTPRLAPSRDSFFRDTPRRDAPSPSSSWSSVPRPSASDRMRVEPRNVAPSPSRVRVEPRSFGPSPSRIRVEPRSIAPSPSRVRVEPRSFGPSPSRIRAEPRSFAPSPSRSFAPSPSRSFAPSAMPRMHGGGGRRR